MKRQPESYFGVEYNFNGKFSNLYFYRKANNIYALSPRKIKPIKGTVELPNHSPGGFRAELNMATKEIIITQ